MMFNIGNYSGWKFLTGVQLEVEVKTCRFIHFAVVLLLIPLGEI